MTFNCSVLLPKYVVKYLCFIVTNSLSDIAAILKELRTFKIRVSVILLPRFVVVIFRLRMLILCDLKLKLLTLTVNDINNLK